VEISRKQREQGHSWLCSRESGFDLFGWTISFYQIVVSYWWSTSFLLLSTFRVDTEPFPKKRNGFFPRFDFALDLLLSDKAEDLSDPWSGIVAQGHNIVTGDERRRMEDLFLAKQFQEVKAVVFNYLIVLAR
jgi:hypothetical protein